MNILKTTLILSLLIMLTGCAAVPFGIGLIPGAPSYVSSVIGNGQTVYKTAMDERTTEQQMLDAIIEGHAQAELYKHKEVEPLQITAYSYFNKLYLVGEYESQEQLKAIYECADKVKNKRAVISRLYIKEEGSPGDYFADQALATEIKTQLMVDFEVTSSPIDIEIIQGDVILLGVIADKKERDRIMAHALSTEGVNRVVSYLYHSENSGPKPRIMTAQLAPPLSTKKPKAVKRKRKLKKPVQQKASKAAPPLASNTPAPPLVVNGRVTGL